MNTRFIKINLVATILLLLFPLFIFGMEMPQGIEEVEMADTMRSNGKIYIVVATITVIFLGIIAYLVSIEKKLKKLEKQLM